MQPTPIDKITWDTDCNAPCCPGQILNNRTGATRLIQTDWDYPGVASTFGWSLQSVQRCPDCGTVFFDDDCPQTLICDQCDDTKHPSCPHDGTDGTVDCSDCGLSAGDFIRAAGEWLSDNDGAIVDDPGYFTE